MFIKDILASTKPSVSFEIFPPKKDSPVETIYQTINELKDLNPDFISVTYGAGGTSKDQTIEIASYIKNKCSVESLGHLTCMGASKDEINKILGEFKNNNVKNIMALRGDLPQNIDGTSVLTDFKYAIDLVTYIKAQGDFCIGGAAHPEGHVESHSKAEDLQHLKEKVDAGIDFLATQLFFDNEIFYKFKESTDKLGINVPIIVGIMPVLNAKQIERIVTLSGASIPPQISRIMARYADNPEALYQAGIAYATEQIIDLLSWGVEGVHLYTMNKPQVAIEIMKNISVVRKSLTQK